MKSTKLILAVLLFVIASMVNYSFSYKQGNDLNLAFLGKEAIAQSENSDESCEEPETNCYLITICAQGHGGYVVCWKEIYCDESECE